MGRDHGVAGSIEQDPLQGSVVLGPRRDVMGSLLGQSPLHGLKQLAVDQWRLRARADLTFIENLADVEAIAQEVEQGTLREGHAAARAAVRQLADLCSHIARSASSSTMESLPSSSSYRLKIVRTRSRSSSTSRLTLPSVGRRNAAAGTLELREREQHVQSESAHRRRRVELLGHRNANDTPCASNNSTSLAKSAGERVRRSTL